MHSILIFDLDGTLIDSRADLALAINLMRADFGLPPFSLDTVVSMVGDGIQRLMTRALHDLHTPWEMETAVAAMRRHYQDHLLDETKLYPHVAETLAILKNNWRLAVATNKTTSEAKKICQQLGIADLLDTIVGGSCCQHLKPHPGLLLRAIELTGSSAAGSWMIGDHRTDLGAAQAAGVRGCFCSYGFGVQDNLRADAVIPCFAALPLVVGNNLNAPPELS